jgi:hypothetical protein
MGDCTNPDWWCVEDYGLAGCGKGGTMCAEFGTFAFEPAGRTGRRALRSVARVVFGVPNPTGDSVSAYGLIAGWGTDSIRRMSLGHEAAFITASCYEIGSPIGTGRDRWGGGCGPFSGLASTCGFVSENGGHLPHELWCTPKWWHGEWPYCEQWRNVPADFRADGDSEQMVFIHDLHTCTANLNHSCWGHKWNEWGEENPQGQAPTRGMWMQCGIVLHSVSYRRILGAVEHRGVRTMRNWVLEAISDTSSDPFTSLDRVYQYEHAEGEGGSWNWARHNYWSNTKWHLSHSPYTVGTVQGRPLAGGDAVTLDYRITSVRIAMWLDVLHRIGGGDPPPTYAHPAVQIVIQVTTDLVDSSGQSGYYVEGSEALGDATGGFIAPVGANAIEWRGELGPRSDPAWEDVYTGGGEVPTCCCIAKQLGLQQVTAKQTTFDPVPPNWALSEREYKQLWSGHVHLNFEIDGPFSAYGCNFSEDPCLG